MSDKDRIRLAEAMGICPSDHDVSDDTWTEWGKCPLCGVRAEDAHKFDPFTSADDDYAVLEWMRKEQYWWATVQDALTDVGMVDTYAYKIGDYARAALKVLDDG